jgi:hypothetical protein
MHGRQGFTFDQPRRERIAKFLDRGGTLLADSVCAAGAFTKAFRDEIAAMLQPEQSPYACAGPSLAPTGNDPHWMASPALRRRSVVAKPGDMQPALGQLWDHADHQPELVISMIQLGWQLGYH